MPEGNRVRKLFSEEALEVIYSLDAYAFHPSPPLTDKEEWMGIVRSRPGASYFALYEDEKPRSGAAYTVMSQQVRGKLFPAHGVWAVSTEIGARRQGYCREVITELLRDGRQAGHIFSCLYPFRESFYERLGYVTFPQLRTATLTPASLAGILKKDLPGSVEIELIGDGFQTYRDYLFRLQLRTHGMAIFTEGDVTAAQRNRSWLAKAIVNGELVGIMLYQITGEEIMKFLLRAYRFYYDNSLARYLLLQWLARHVDQAGTIEIWLQPGEMPETWLSDIAVKVESADRPAAMSRVLDVSGLSGLKIGQGEFCAQVNDPLCPWNSGAWWFRTVDSQLQVTPGGEPQFELTIQGLTALIFGAHDPADFPIRGWGTPDECWQGVMREMFPPRQPYMHELF